jgi:CheY-like chemotaxis protein
MEEAHPHAGPPPLGEVLVVDDSPVERMLATAVLRKLGFSVTCAASAEQALARMASHRFVLAICDISLPGMDGLALLAAMRQRPPAPPCIVLSAHDDALHADAALRAGASAYLVKPLRLESLRAALGRLFP